LTRRRLKRPGEASTVRCPACRGDILKPLRLAPDFSVFECTRCGQNLAAASNVGPVAIPPALAAFLVSYQNAPVDAIRKLAVELAR
jgi:hypothetical protein